MAKYVTVNDSVNEVGIKKYKATPNKIDRGSILSFDKKLISKIHFVPGLGYIHCFGGKCCALYGNPSIKNTYPLVKYPSDADGNLIPGDIELQMLSINNTKDKSIKLKNKVLESEGKKISDIDLFFTGGEEQSMDGGGKFVDYDIDNAGAVSWKKNKLWSEQLKDKWGFYDQNIETSIAKVVKDDKEFFELLAASKDKNAGLVKPNNTTQVTSNVHAPKQIESKPTVIESNVNEDDFFTTLEKEVVKEQTAEVIKTETTFDIFNQA